MRKGRDELKRGLFSQKEPELKDLEHSQPLHIAEEKRRNLFCENTKCVAEQSFDKELSGDQGLKQPSLQKPGVEVGPTPVETLPAAIKRQRR